MLKRNKKLIFFAGALLMLTLVVSACGGKQYPEKEVTFVCPWSPGGSSDLIVRTMSKIASKDFPKPFVVVNRDGANGMIATTELSKTKPDGYTISLGTTGLFTTTPITQKNVTYKMEQFDFLVGLTNEPIVISVPAGSPYKTLDDLIRDAKEKNFTIRYANSGIGGVPQLALAYLFQLSGVKSEPIPFKGSAPAITAALGNHVEALACHPGEVLPHAKAGKLVPLAISSLQRFSALPDVPTMKEKGYDVDLGVKKFIFAPKGMPDDAKKLLVEKLTKAANDPEFQKTMTDAGLMVDILNGKQLEDYIKTQYPIMKKLIESMSKK